MVSTALRDLWRRLESAGVPYCVLAPAPAGARAGPRDRLDILIERRRAADFDQAAAAAGCKRLQNGEHPGGAEFLAFDAARGELIHLRACHELPVDGSSTDGQRPDWEHAVLQSRRQDAATGCYVLDPDLAIRLQPAWSPQTGGAAPGWWRRPGARRRAGSSATMASGGISVALLGCDGSGKSTVTDDLLRWLRPCLRVDYVYLGSGQGSCSLLRRPFWIVHQLLQKRSSSQAPAEGTGRRSGLRRALRRLWGLLLAREKRQKLRTLWRARRQGAVVICDRYPQDQIMDFNDGPLLSDWGRHRSRWRRALARWERQPYQWAQQDPPDLVVKLRVSAPVALARKPDMTGDEIARRIAAVDSLTFGGRTRTLVVDADAPIDQVLREVRAAIWAEF